MASPRSMFSGSIELGLVNVPITIGKAFETQREGSLTEVAEFPDGTVEKILRNEHLESGRTDFVKRTAVQTSDGEYRVFDEAEYAAIEESTKTPTLKILDVQPASKLPLLYSTGAYYVRHDPNSKVAPTAMATLVATMMTERLALICKWGNATRQKLCVLTAEAGLLILRQVPFIEDIRKASDKEREHMRVKVDPKHVEQMGELLSAIQNPDGFDYAAYRDEGLAMRQAAVDRILSGEAPEQKAPEPKREPVDFEAMIDKALAEARA